MATLIGFDMLHYATLTTDPTAGEATYGTPVRVVGAVSASINPNTSESTFFADDGPMETASTLGQIELTISSAKIPKKDLAALLGHTITTAGILVKKSTDTPPWVAVGGRALKSNGKYKYFWLLKGKMTPSESNYQTKEDSVEFQPDSISGSFVKRDSDQAWYIEVDEDDEEEGVAAAVAAWFTSVPKLTAGA